MSSNIKVTVYCAAYNHEKYIKDALEGFIMQKTNFDFEVLVHDDASTDGTAIIIKEYELKYPNIIKPIYQKENIYSKGINRTYEYMLPRTNGKYIAICEGDDYWTDPYKLQKQYDYMEMHPNCSLVAHKTMCNYIEANYSEPFTNYDFSKKENCELEAKDVISNHSLFHTSSLFFKKEYYNNNKKFLMINKNFDYVIKILLATEGYVHVIPEFMSVYRSGTESSWTKNVRNSSKYIEHVKYAIDVLEKIDEYKDYQFTYFIQKNILQRKFDMYVELGEFNVIKSEPFKEIYKGLSFKRKVIIYIKRWTPSLYNIILKGSIYSRIKQIKNGKKYTI